MLPDCALDVIKRNVVASRKFSQMLAEALNRYQNRTIDAAQVIAEIVEFAKATQEQRHRGEQTGLTDNELAFYDAMLTNDSARLMMEDATLRKIAHDLTEIVRNDAKTDWQLKEQVRAKLRTRSKRLLLRHRYPPDQEPTATELVKLIRAPDWLHSSFGLDGLRCGWQGRP